MTLRVSDQLWVDGANAALAAPVLPETNFVSGLNVSIRGGLVRTRPRFTRVADLGLAGTFNGAGVYRLNSGDTIVLLAGRQAYRVPVASPVPVTVGAEFSTEAQGYFVQADKYFVVQNGVSDPENWPLVIDGSDVVDVPEAKVFDGESSSFKKVSELTTPEAKRTPIGTVMAYGHGRLFVVVDRVWENGLLTGTAGWQTGLGRRFFLAGNIIQPDNVQELLAFTETDYLAEGGALAPASEVGFINGMEWFRNAATGTGLGALVVFARDGVCAFSVNAPRSQWKNIDMAQVLFRGPGTESPRSIVAVNDDLWFRSRDGMRALRYTTSQEAGQSGSLSSVPRSQEVGYVLARDTDATRPLVSAAFVDNRLLFTASGVAGTEPYFQALVSLDGNVIGSLRGQQAPAYDGIWAGLRFLQVLRARDGSREQAYVVARGATNLELWKVDDDALTDQGTAPLCRVVTRAVTWSDRNVLKAFRALEVSIRDLRGDATVTAYWRPDGYPLWNRCNTVSLSAPADGLAQRRRQVRLTPANADRLCDPTTGLLLNRSTGFQFCIEWTGVLALEPPVYYADPVAEERGELSCTPEQGVALVEGEAGLVLDDFTDYEVA